MDHSLPVICTVKVIYAFMAREEGDLNMNKGDIIKVHDNDGGWWKGTLVPDGIYGTFPSNFVELINQSDDSLDSPLSPRAQGHSRQSSRQGSVDSSKFTRRKPVGAVVVKNTTSSTSNLSCLKPNDKNTSSVSLGATSRKNPQAVIGDSGLCSTLPGAFPDSNGLQESSPVEISDEAVYSHGYTPDQQRRNSASIALLNPSGPSTSLSPARSVNGKHVSNRYSMPNLAGDCLKQQQQLHQQNQGIYNSHNTNMPASAVYLQNSVNPGSACAPATRSTSHLPQGNHFGASTGGYSNYEIPYNQGFPCDHNYEDSPHFQPGIMAPSSIDRYSQQFGPGQYNPHQPNYIPSGIPGRKQSITTISASPLGQSPHDQGFSSINHSALSLENLEKHNRSQSALDPPKSQFVHGSNHGRSVSQTNLIAEGGPAFNPYDHQQLQQQKQPQQIHSTPMARMAMSSRAPSPSIVIPQFGGRPHSAFAAFSSTQISPTESSPTSSSAVSNQQYLLNSPTTPDTTVSKGSATPTSAGTSMSEASAFSLRDSRRKSETARMPPSSSMATSNFTARKFSIDANRSLAGVSPDLTIYSDDTTEDLEVLGTYTSRKPKATLIRAFKQIINPKKVAEKDAIRDKNEHFAWIEMQKSLKRVSSPEIGKDQPFFAHQQLQDQDPFEVLKKCQVMRDDLIPPAGPTNCALDFGPNAFVQVDKVARNVNQRGPHMTPQLLSQKYLTRPYSKSPLSKLRVLFVWVSENIRLEGGPTRDVSGGRYKLGPGGEYMEGLAVLANGNAAEQSPSLRPGATVPPPAVFMAGVEEYVRGFIQEDTPELAQDVLTTRTCKTGEGFANLFAEMALAAGIEDVGVVKGYIKGPMDVFSKDIPPPNHAWNVVRIDGTYRFIDCCLASPFHPAHYPNRPQAASSFYFLTSPTDLVLSHNPVFLTYQYITPSIPPQIFLQLPFVRPAYFDFGLSLPDFKKLTKLDIKDDEPIEVVIRIDGGGISSLNSTGGSSNGQGPLVAGAAGSGQLPGIYGGECLGRGCGEGIELRAEVEVMTSEGKVIRKRALAQVMIWNPYQHHASAPQKSQPQPPQQGATSSTLSMAGSANIPTSIAAVSNRTIQLHHCTGIRVAKIKAVLPPDTVVGAGGIRKGVLHIYAGRKVENAPSDATPYSLALSLPIRHTGLMPKTPLNFVLPHFSPYEFYVKAPQTELLYYPHTYMFSILSLAAQAQAALASASVITIADNEANPVTGANNPTASIGSINSTITSPRHLRTMGGSFGGIRAVQGSSSLNPLFVPHHQHAQTIRGSTSASAQTLVLTGSSPTQVSRLPISSTTASMGTMRGGIKNYTHQHQHYQLNSSGSMASTSSSSTTGGITGNDAALGEVAVPRPERLVLRTQTNRIYKLVYDPVRQCHEAQVDVKERGIWECVRMDDGGKNRVGREGTGGVVVASWKCV
ncbi:cytokinesis protein 3 [Mortierella sp. AM989]|nr:cytokinesis protein 3 [Mortierella sp. AM989]